MRDIKFRAWFNNKMDHTPHGWDEYYGETMPINEAISQAILDGQILMQYTGLKDKNGKEIYEGDVLTKNIYWDVQKTELVRFTVKFIYGCFMLVDRDDRRYNISKYNEVIGNIHENPELL